MKYSIIVFVFLTILGINGCGYKEGVITAGQKSYLYFTGNVKEVKVFVDNGEGFEVEEGLLHQYVIATGKHTILIKRRDQIVVKREIFISDGVAKEIEVQQ